MDPTAVCACQGKKNPKKWHSQPSHQMRWAVIAWSVTLFLKRDFSFCVCVFFPEWPQLYRETDTFLLWQVEKQKVKLTFKNSIKISFYSHCLKTLLYLCLRTHEHIGRTFRLSHKVVQSAFSIATLASSKFLTGASSDWRCSITTLAKTRQE